MFRILLIVSLFSGCNVTDENLVKRLEYVKVRGDVNEEAVDGDNSELNHIDDKINKLNKKIEKRKLWGIFIYNEPDESDRERYIDDLLNEDEVFFLLKLRKMPIDTDHEKELFYKFIRRNKKYQGILYRETQKLKEQLEQENTQRTIFEKRILRDKILFYEQILWK